TRKSSDRSKGEIPDDQIGRGCAVVTVLFRMFTLQWRHIQFINSVLAKGRGLRVSGGDEHAGTANCCELSSLKHSRCVKFIAWLVSEGQSSEYIALPGFAAV